MNRKEISVFLKRGISELTELALSLAKTPQEQARIYMLHEDIYVGLGEYESAWRAEVKRVADNVQEEMREE